MQVGDRVRLTDVVAQRMARSRHLVDWISRRGTITKRPLGQAAAVLWDGRKSIDMWPLTALTVLETEDYSSSTSEVPLHEVS